MPDRKLTIADLNTVMEETQRVMARNLAESLYGDNTLAAYLARHAGRKPRKWSIGYEIEKWRGRLGRLFLKVANALGEYNDYY